MCSYMFMNYETANIAEVSTSEVCVQSSAELRHVTFPNHFQVPKALKSGLTFGSFDTFGPSEESNSGAGGDNNASPALELSDETATSRFVIHMLLLWISNNRSLSLSPYIPPCVCECVFPHALFNGVRMTYGCIILAFVLLYQTPKQNYNLPEVSTRQVGKPLWR